MNQQFRPVVILHIPKTAGTSLRRMIQEHYQTEEIFYVYGDDSTFTTFDDFKKLAPEEKAAYKIFMGHIPFNQNFFSGLNPIYITILRDPVERVLSYYHHVMQRQEWKGKDVSLLKYIEISEDRQLSNHQTRVLAGYVNEPLNEIQLEIAINNLNNHFSVVGTTDNYKEAVEALCNLMGWEHKTIYRENISTDRKQAEYYSKIEIEKIKKLNVFDLKLYDYVLKGSNNGVILKSTCAISVPSEQ